MRDDPALSYPAPRPEMQLVRPIHGAGVWDGFDGRLCRCHAAVRLVRLDLYDPVPDSVDGWVAELCERVEGEGGSPENALLGYSMGGRLALRAVVSAPAPWRGAVVVGADPGLAKVEERAAQLRRDRRWGARFLNDPWDNVLADWDRLPVFGGAPCRTSRRADEFDPASVAKAFDVFSKGRQPDLRPALSCEGLPPILYASGASDTTCRAVGAALQASSPAVRHCVIDGKGHRVPWERPQAFIRPVNEFLETLSALPT